MIRTTACLSHPRWSGERVKKITIDLKESEHKWLRTEAIRQKCRTAELLRRALLFYRREMEDPMVLGWSCPAK
jgi:hypothetical protein